MARKGSKREFEYTADNGLGYVIQQDEDWGEAPGTGFGVIQLATLQNDRRVMASGNKFLTPRYIIGTFINGDDDVSRIRRVIGSATAPLWTGAVNSFISDDGNTYIVTSYCGEKRSVVPAFDTAQQDGDADTQIAAAP